MNLYRMAMLYTGVLAAALLAPSVAPQRNIGSLVGGDTANAQQVAGYAQTENQVKAMQFFKEGFRLATQEKKYEEALDMYRKGVELNPIPMYVVDSPNAAIKAIREKASSLIKEKPDEAIALLNGAIKTNPEIASLYNSLGVIYSQKGDLPKAISFYLQAIERQPDFIPPMVSMGYRLTEMNDHKAALFWNSVALMLDGKQLFKDSVSRQIAVNKKFLGA